MLMKPIVAGHDLAEESKKRTYLQGATFTEQYLCHPIPLNAIDRSQGTLTQNPGY